ncbi:MAG: type IV pilus assembly protein PilM [Endomicrobiia bacterium]
MFLDIFSNKRCVGLDIGSKSIKIVYLIYCKEKKYKLNTYKILPLPLEISSSEMPQETKNSIIAQIIKDFFSKHKSLPKKVAISVSGPSVVVRYIKLPIMTKEELEKSISIEVEPFIPFPLSDVYLSFDILGEVLDEGVKKNELVVVAAKKDFIDSKISLLKGCKLMPVHIDVDVFALENLIKYNYNIENEIVCVVNIGWNITNVGIIENGITRVCRDLPIGLISIVNNLKKTQQFEEQTIIEYLKNDGLIITEEQKEQYLQEDKKTELLFSKNLILSLKEFVSELHKVVDFYYFQKGEQKPLSKIFLSGGGSVIRNLDLYFSDEFKVETEIVDPFRNIEVSEEIPLEIKQIFAVAVGLAMR